MENKFMDISKIRKEYQSLPFDKMDLDSSPFRQFEKWFQEALQSEVMEPNAMALSTVNSVGQPNCRMVLLKKWDDNGFVFFTNYGSPKAHALDDKPEAALTFFWKELERQIRIEGIAEHTSKEDSAIYFAQRPRKSQLSAWASNQSQPVESREALEKEYDRCEKLYEGQDVPLPPFWGGFRIKPIRFEFWQGRRDRLHDRFEYKLEKGKWIITRLSP